MTPPTRLERLVQEEAMYLSGNMAKRLPLADVMNLLRREQARVRRIVKAQPKTKGYVDDLIRRDDLLAALRNGTR